MSREREPIEVVEAVDVDGESLAARVHDAARGRPLILSAGDDEAVLIAADDLERALREMPLEVLARTSGPGYWWFGLQALDADGGAWSMEGALDDLVDNVRRRYREVLVSGSTDQRGRYGAAALRVLVADRRGELRSMLEAVLVYEGEVPEAPEQSASEPVASVEAFRAPSGRRLRRVLARLLRHARSVPHDVRSAGSVPAPDPGIVRWDVLPAVSRLDDEFPRRARTTLLRGVGWSIEAAQRHERPCLILDEVPDLQPATGPRLVVYEFESRRARAEWLRRRLDAFEAAEWDALGVPATDQLIAARRWVRSEVARPPRGEPGK